MTGKSWKVRLLLTRKINGSTAVSTKLPFRKIERTDQGGQMEAQHMKSVLQCYWNKIRRDIISHCRFPILSLVAFSIEIHFSKSQFLIWNNIALWRSFNCKHWRWFIQPSCELTHRTYSKSNIIHVLSLKIYYLQDTCISCKWKS